MTTSEALRIYVDRLRAHEVEQIHETVPSDFLLEASEEDLQFLAPVRLEGEAYLAHQELVLKLSLSATALMPCAVCNKPVEVKIHIPELLHMEPLTAFKRGYFDMTDVVREAILLEVPLVTECQGGQCPDRKEMERYLKKKSDREGDEGYHPFADLESRE